jgi:arylsulfatase A-like enzyme
MRRLAWLLLLGGCAAPAPAPTAPPNVLMIVSDDQAWTDFGFMGHPVVKTPHLDRLAAESTLYPNGYVPTSLCRASLATILTGQYAHQHRICCNDPPDGVDRSAMLPFLKSAPALPRLLQAKGYRSFQTGKFWEGHYSNGGFTDGMTEKGRHGDAGLEIGRKTLKPITDFVERSGTSPWFVWYAPMMPHEPHTPPDRLLKKYAVEGRPLALARYWAMVEWFDETCGELLGWLDATGRRENTLVVFVVDNGWIQETGGVRRTRGNFAPKSKLSPYDGGLRTPLILRRPGRAAPERRTDLASTIDLAPTILRAVGLPPDPRMPGLDLLAPGPLPRDAVYGDLYVHTAVDVERPALNLTHRWVRRGDWKLILPKDPKERPELFDVAKDPHEERNLAAAEPARVKELGALIDGWWAGR